MTFGKLLPVVREQLDKQTAKEKMAAVMSTYTKLERTAGMKLIPLPVKCTALRIAHCFCGEQSSCISVSNMGVVSFPDEMAQYIVQTDFDQFAI